MLIPLGYGQINYVFGGPGLPRGAEVTFGFLNTVANLTADTAAAQAAGAWDTWIRVAQNVNASLLSVRCKLGPNDEGPDAVFPVNTAGANTSGEMQPQIAALVRKNTAVGGHRGRGRMYWPILGEGDVANGGLLTPSFTTGLQAAMVGFLAELDTRQIPMYLLHSAIAEPPHEVTSVSAQIMVATQRRRLRG